MSNSGYERLAEFVVRERARRGYRSRAAFARAIGVGKRTLDKIETGMPSNYRPRTIAAIEGGLGLAPGSFEGIIEGRPPKRLADESLPTLLDLWPELSDDAKAAVLRIVELLAARS
jgi:transcriptional regulator with XRE-family HTH domain